MTKNLPIEDVETMSYSELAKLILEKANKKMKIIDVFKKISTIKGLSEEEFESKISDFFELISTDKTFIILEKGYCDLKIHHTPNVLIEESDDDDDAIDVIVDSIDDEEDEDVFYDSSSDEDDITDSDEKDIDKLYVIDEKEE